MPHGLPRILSRSFISSLLLTFSVLFPVYLLAKLPSPTNSLELRLKKDEVFVSKVGYGSENAPLRGFSVRWTLYKGKGLVVHVKYDDYVHQYVMYRGHPNNRVLINLNSLHGVPDSIDSPYITLVFNDIYDPHASTESVASFTLSLYGSAVMKREDR